PGPRLALRAGAWQRSRHRLAGQGEPARDGAVGRADAGTSRPSPRGAAAEPRRRRTGAQRSADTRSGAAARWSRIDHRAGRQRAAGTGQRNALKKITAAWAAAAPSPATT